MRPAKHDTNPRTLSSLSNMSSYTFVPLPDNVRASLNRVVRHLQAETKPEWVAAYLHGGFQRHAIGVCKLLMSLGESREAQVECRAAETAIGEFDKCRREWSNLISRIVNCADNQDHCNEMFITLVRDLDRLIAQHWVIHDAYPPMWEILINHKKSVEKNEAQ